MGVDVIAQLIQEGAQALVGAMATDAWAGVRKRVAKLFGRGDHTAEQAEETTLDEFRNAIESAQPELLDEVIREQQAELRGMLRVRLAADPVLAAEFASLVADVRGLVAQPGSGATMVRQTARADRGSTVTQAGRDVRAWPPGRR